MASLFQDILQPFAEMLANMAFGIYGMCSTLYGYDRQMYQSGMQLLSSAQGNNALSSGAFNSLSAFSGSAATAYSMCLHYNLTCSEEVLEVFENFRLRTLAVSQELTPYWKQNDAPPLVALSPQEAAAMETLLGQKPEGFIAQSWIKVLTNPGLNLAAIYQSAGSLPTPDFISNIISAGTPAGMIRTQQLLSPTLQGPADPQGLLQALTSISKVFSDVFIPWCAGVARVLHDYATDLSNTCYNMGQVEVPLTQQ